MLDSPDDWSRVDKKIRMKLKGFVSSSIPCTCRLLADLCLSPFSWAMKMATTKASQGTTRADTCKECWMKQTL